MPLTSPSPNTSTSRLRSVCDNSSSRKIWVGASARCAASALAMRGSSDARARTLLRSALRRYASPAPRWCRRGQAAADARPRRARPAAASSRRRRCPAHSEYPTLMAWHPAWQRASRQQRADARDVDRPVLDLRESPRSVRPPRTSARLGIDLDAEPRHQRGLGRGRDHGGAEPARKRSDQFAAARRRRRRPPASVRHRRETAARAASGVAVRNASTLSASTVGV